MNCVLGSLFLGTDAVAPGSLVDKQGILVVVHALHRDVASA